MVAAIIGANYGDEGKGLAVNYFTKKGTNLVVRHNGGAQSGHTVEIDGKRFLFHELSSGSFNDAATFWDTTYYPDLFVFSKEYDDFFKLTGKSPKIYCTKDTKITLIDDVFLNRFRETQYKFGSCGMGIWECVCRIGAGYGVTVEEVKNSDVMTLFNKFMNIRVNYTFKRLKFLQEKYGNKPNEYIELLNDVNVLFNYITIIKQNIEYVEIVNSLGEIFDKFDNVIYENGQGLMIDGDLDIENGTPSKTGMYNVINSLNKINKKLDEAVYVTRTFLTRHGRGQFVKECDIIGSDETNVYNEWQEGLRYGKFNSIEELEKRINIDCPFIKPHLLVTHANITDNKMYTYNGNVSIENLNFEKIYVSNNKFGVNEII